MPHPWMAPGAALTLTFLSGVVLLGACAQSTPSDVPTLPAVTRDVVTAAPTAAPTAASTAASTAALGRQLLRTW